MNNVRSHRVALAVAVALSTLAGAAGAQTQLAAAPMASPMTQHQGAATLLSGGVTLDESMQMRRMMSQYPMRIVMSAPNGDYEIADSLTILRNGEVVAQLSEAGPYVLADLAPGRYTVQASFAGVSQTRAVSVGGGGTTLHLVVPTSR